ncbi:MAG: hypothetical protein RPU73_06295 [Candidatus Sedimenticola sp. (ex Thyasira tokunagai)]
MRRLYTLDESSTVLRCPHVQEDFFHGTNIIEGWQGLGEAEDSAVFALAGADQALTHGRAGNLKGLEASPNEHGPLFGPRAAAKT